MKSILFICHGNICRSPMAECIFADLVKKQGLSGEYYIQSAATSTEEIGNPIHYGTKRVLRENGVPLLSHISVQLKKSDYKKYDIIIGMDFANIRNILKIIGEDPKQKVHLMMDYAGEHREVADPWYTGDFEKTYQDILKACKCLLKKIEEEK